MRRGDMVRGYDAPMEQARLYLDNAATSFPKPACVHEAMVHYATRVGASPGRGAYAEAIEGGRIVDRCRERIRRLIGGDRRDHVVFTLNTSDALDLAIKGVVSYRRRTEPDRPVHLVATAMDHNSVLRPFNALRQAGVVWTCVACDGEGFVSPEAIRSAIRPETALVAVIHASNVSGTLQPVERIGVVCREAGVPLLVDGAQSLGHVPIDVAAMGIDLLAFPGHKGLLGPLGTGALYLGPGMERVVDSVRQGGTGTVSESDIHPETLPEKYEAGSLNTIGIAGLDAALGWILDRGIEQIWAHERGLIEAMIDGLDSLGRAHPGLRPIGPRGVSGRVGVFSITHEAVRPEVLADELERRAGILVRSGIHCAPRAHAAFGTLAGESVGATRLSVGPFVTPGDIERACDAIGAVLGSARRTVVGVR